MESSVVNNIVETVLEKTSSNYVRKDEIIEAFKDVGTETSLDAIYDRYIKTKEDLERIKALKTNCKSDYIYWNYVSEEETTRIIERICAEILFSKININDLLEIKTTYLKAQELDSIKARIHEEIDGLGKYKPNGYKSKIELLNSLLRDNNNN